jgi:hypothetical protein
MSPTLAHSKRDLVRQRAIAPATVAAPQGHARAGARDSEEAPRRRSEPVWFSTRRKTETIVRREPAPPMSATRRSTHGGYGRGVSGLSWRDVYLRCDEHPERFIVRQRVQPRVRHAAADRTGHAARPLSPSAVASWPLPDRHDNRPLRFLGADRQPLHCLWLALRARISSATALPG